MKGILLAALLFSVPAWAVGERITVTGPLRDQLSETLCVPMECGTADGAISIVSRAAADGVVVKVLGADGTVRWSQKLTVNDEGRVPSMELITASTAMVKAIEAPQARAEAAAEAAKPVAKASAKKLAAKKSAKPGKSVRLAMVRTR
jgi:hypothetical protein